MYPLYSSPIIFQGCVSLYGDAVDILKGDAGIFKLFTDNYGDSSNRFNVRSNTALEGQSKSIIE